MIEAVFVMMNNYFHDLGVGFLFASGVLAHIVLRYWPGRPSEEVVILLQRVGWGSLAWVLVGGAIRLWFFQEYEWSPKAGTAQIPALAVKHVLLFALTIWGLVGVARLGKYRRIGEEL